MILKEENSAQSFFPCFLSKPFRAKDPTASSASPAQKPGMELLKLFLSSLMRQALTELSFQLVELWLKQKMYFLWTFNLQSLKKQKVGLSVSGKNSLASLLSGLWWPSVLYHDSRWVWKLLSSLAGWASPRRAIYFPNKNEEVLFCFCLSIM